MNKETKYYTVLQDDLRYMGFQYKEGLNIDPKFSYSMRGSGIYFSDISVILDFHQRRCKIADVTIPDDSEIIRFDKIYKARSIILSNIRDLWTVETMEGLINEGLNIDIALSRASYLGNLDVVQYLLDYGADIHADNDSALREALRMNRKEVVSCLLKHDADIRIYLKYKIDMFKANYSFIH